MEALFATIMADLRDQKDGLGVCMVLDLAAELYGEKFANKVDAIYQILTGADPYREVIA